jgi:hypothetical protein
MASTIFAGGCRVELLIDALRRLPERCCIGLGDGHALGTHLVLNRFVLIQDEVAIELPRMRPGVHDGLAPGRVLFLPGGLGHDQRDRLVGVADVGDILHDVVELVVIERVDPALGKVDHPRLQGGCHFGEGDRRRDHAQRLEGGDQDLVLLHAHLLALDVGQRIDLPVAVDAAVSGGNEPDQLEALPVEDRVVVLDDGVAAVERLEDVVVVAKNVGKLEHRHLRDQRG